MLTRLIHFWEGIRGNYWLLPGLLLLAAILLAYSLLAADVQIDLAQVRGLRWLVFASAEGARVVLSTIATSTFAAATLTFSVTMVTLNLTSSQFGPRLLRNFLRDPFNQFIFGAFIATFIYCLLVLRGMGVNGGRVPSISVSLSIVMVLIDAALFIWFIHHVTSSIRVEHITAEIGKEFIGQINRLFPDPVSREGHDKKRYPNEALFNEPHSVLVADRYGYLQAIDYRTLTEIAATEQIFIRLLFKPGHFILPGATLAEIRPKDRSNDTISRSIRNCLILGATPSAEQDVEFTVRQLVQVAARALSPGINDPFTAMSCIDYLAAGLAILATRQLPESAFHDKEGKPLLHYSVPTFHHVCDACFRIIRQMSTDNPSVVIYLLDTLIQLARIVERPEDLATVSDVAKLAAEAALLKCEREHDRRAIEERLSQLVKAGSHARA